MKRIFITGIFIFIAIVLVLPAGVASLFNGEPLSKPQDLKEKTVQIPEQIPKQIPVKIFRKQTQSIETLPLELYVTGVVSAEMPAEFKMEALKAQALVARTYIIRRMAEKDYSDVPGGAYVTDTVQHQVFLDDKQRKQRWGADYEWKMNKIKRAVSETSGQVITYQGKPINATYFSTSNGYTENSEEYWQHKIPYLRSVAVPWDKKSPKYRQVTTMPIQQFQQKLGVQLSVPVSTNDSSWSQVVSWSTGRRIAKIKVGDNTFSGREIRERLQLPSSHFTWEIKGDEVYITTSGFGHGVGMSQWGANGMAEEGKSYREIVKYFYQNVAIQDYHQWIKREQSTQNG